jgi:phosphoribosyl 1,2-cyclic phosphate phosphodiesterase
LPSNNKINLSTYFIILAVVTFLGTGTSQGVPVIGCACAVCTSTNPHDQRLRSSVLYINRQTNILIDAGPDLRQQMLRAKVTRLDAIFLTHEHNDHVIGLDDVRPFNFSSGQPMRIYALPRVTYEVRKRFEYVFGEPIPGIPQIELIDIFPGQKVQIGEVEIEAIEIMHGKLPILAFRMDSFVYITDMKTIEPNALNQVLGAEVVVLNALHKREHHAHMTLQEALQFAEYLQQHKTGLKGVWLTHMSHHMGLVSDTSQLLPELVRFSYDQLTLSV